MAWYSVSVKRYYNLDYYLEHASSKEECIQNLPSWKYDPEEDFVFVKDTDVSFGITSTLDDYLEEDIKKDFSSLTDGNEPYFIAEIKNNDTDEILKIAIQALSWKYAVKIFDDFTRRIQSNKIKEFVGNREIIKYSEILKLPNKDFFSYDSCMISLSAFCDKPTFIKDYDTLYLENGYEVEYGVFDEGFSKIKRVVLQGDFDFSENVYASFASLKNMECFIVESEDFGYFTEDGILYMHLNDRTRHRKVVDSEDLWRSASNICGKVLVAVPPQYPNKTLQISEEVKVIAPNAFCNTNIETLVIPDSIEVIDGYAFRGMNKLKTISVPKKDFFIIYDDNFIPNVEIQWRGEEGNDESLKEIKLRFDNITSPDWQ